MQGLVSGTDLGSTREIDVVRLVTLAIVAG